MSLIDERTSVLDRYFEAWSALDPRRVGELFHPDATYERDGKPTFHGIGEIEAYWHRNRERQGGLRVFQHVPIENRTDACTFCARFVDTEERETQIVHGWIVIETTDGRIRRLREAYHVQRDPIVDEVPATISDWFADRLRRARWKLVDWKAVGIDLLVSKASRILYYLVLAVIGGSAFGVARLPDLALCTFAFEFQACGVDVAARRTELQAEVARNLGWLAFLSVVLLPLLYRTRQNYLAPVETIRLVDDGQDLEEMKRHFRHAKQLTVHAGDFDFVGRDPVFCSIFARLNVVGALDLVSDKSEATVREAFGATPEASALLDSLKRRGRIRFEDPKRLRCSIVRRWDYPEVLYRYEHGGGEGERNRLRICVLRGRGDVAPVVELLRRSTGRVV